MLVVVGVTVMVAMLVIVAVVFTVVVIVVVVSVMMVVVEEGRKNIFYQPPVIHIVKDRSYCERGNPPPPHGYYFRIVRVLYMHNPTYRMTHITVFVTPVENSSMGPPLWIDPTTHRAMSERFYHGGTSLSGVPQRLTELWQWEPHRLIETLSPTSGSFP